MNAPLIKSSSSLREFLGLLLLIVVVLGTRIPFLMHGLDEWDSANFALSVLHFDVRAHQPHPPGQFFYVRLMQCVNGFTGNPLLTLSLSSALCSTLALAPFYLALRQMFRPAVALGACVLTAFTFGYWITSLRMISDPVATLFVYGTVCCLLAGLASRRWFFVGMALCGVTLGVKQTAVYFLAPFVVAVTLVVLFRHGWRRAAAGSGGFALAVAAWLLPTVGNAGGWSAYLAISQTMQRENYDIEAILFHLSADAVHAQWQANLVQPWGTVALAVMMLPLAAAGWVLCLRRGLRGGLFALFSVTVALYSFFFLYRFNKYYVYSVPFYCAFAAAALFALGDFLARQTRRPALGLLVPGVAIALITAANFALALPLLPKINHFRAPPQAALESLLKMPGVGPDPLVLTDSSPAGRALLYFHLQKKVDLLNRHPDLQDAVAALNAGRKVYFLSSTVFPIDAKTPGAVRPLGNYVWRPELFGPLQGRPDLQRLSLYEVNAPLPVRYAFKSAGSHPPLLLEGMSQDGWCGANVRLLLPCDDAGDDLAHLRLTAPEDFGFRYPYRMVCRFADGSHQDLTVEHAGASDFVVSLPGHPGAHAVELQLLAPQTHHLKAGDARLTDRWDLAAHIDALDCVTAARPLIVEHARGWHGQETDGRSQWRWTDGEGVLSVLADRAGTLVLAGSVRSVSPDNAVEVFVDDQPTEVLPLPGEGWVPMTWRLPLTAGLHRVTLHSRNPGVQPPGDGRRLAVCVRDLQARLEP